MGVCPHPPLRQVETHATICKLGFTSVKPPILFYLLFFALLSVYIYIPLRFFFFIFRERRYVRTLTKKKRKIIDPRCFPFFPRRKNKK